jgi:hypothetical protein
MSFLSSRSHDAIELPEDKQHSPAGRTCYPKITGKWVSKDVLKSPCFMLLFERWIAVEKGVG